MNRALLERLNTYQPRPGLAATRPNAFRVLFWAGLVMLLAVVVPSCLALLGGCSPAASQAERKVLTQVDVQAKGEEYGSKVHDCLVSAWDGGTFRDFQKCACDVDRDYKIDAAAAGAECAP